MSIRSAEPADLGRMLELNNAAVPAVNELTADEMAWFLEVAHCCLVAEVPGTPGPSALLVGLDGPSTPYASHNYGWFCGRFDRFLYVDRVAPNEESLAFHAAMGFEALGEFSSEGPVETADETGIKTVMMFARRLDS